MASGSTQGNRRHRSTREQSRLLAIGAAVVIAILFAILNLHTVSVNWIVTTTHTSLTVVIVVSFLIGAGVGALLMRRRASGPSARGSAHHHG